MPSSGAPLQLAHLQPGAIRDDFAVCLIPPSELIVLTSVSKDGRCGNENTLDALTTDEITWCYQVANRSADLATIDALSDSHFGQLITQPVTLESGETYILIRTMHLSTSTSNTVSWTIDNAQTVQQTDVTVLSSELVLDVTAALSAEQCGLNDSLSVPADSSVVLCYEALNAVEGSLLAGHRLLDSNATLLFSDLPYTLPFGETYLYTATVPMISQPTEIAAVWQATDQNVMPGGWLYEAADSVAINIIDPQPEPVGCQQNVRFDAGIPADWTAASTGDPQVRWTHTADRTYCSAGENLAGDGIGLCVDATDIGINAGQSFAATLTSNEIDLTRYYDYDIEQYIDMTQGYGPSWGGELSAQLRFRLVDNNVDE